jgi:hypothetical protein
MSFPGSRARQRSAEIQAVPFSCVFSLPFAGQNTAHMAARDAQFADDSPSGFLGTGGASGDDLDLGQPLDRGVRPSLTPFVRARARPGWMRSWMIDRSNSANMPSI